MVWVTWRQHRTALAGVAALLGVLAAYLLLTGLQIHQAYATSCHPASSLACTINFTGKYAVTVNVARILPQAAPALIGAFAGAPLLAWELRTLARAVPHPARLHGVDQLSAGQPVLALPADRRRLAARAARTAHRHHRLAGPPPGGLNPRAVPVV
jgi:hypothetical protein